MVKLESPGGDGMRHYQPRYGATSYPFHLYNAGKASLAVDLKSASGLAEARRALETADVYLENLGPGVVERLGIGDADVRAGNPDIIYCSVSGYGRTGPFAKRRAYDTVIQGESGIMSLTGRPDVPTKIGVSAADLLGPTFACVAILAALHYRTRRGRGQYLDASMFDVCVWTTQPRWPELLDRGARAATQESEAPRPSGVYRSADGPVLIATETDAQWRNLVGLLDASECAPDAVATERAIADWAGSRSADEIVALCQGAGVPAGRVCSIPEVMTDRRTTDRTMLVRAEDADGLPLILTGSPFKLSRTPGRIYGRAPLLDERDRAPGSPAVGLAPGESPVIPMRSCDDGSPQDIQATDHRKTCRPGIG